MQKNITTLENGQLNHYKRKKVAEMQPFILKTH